jgi:hypothetical protein
MSNTWDPHAKASISPTLDIKNPAYEYFPQELIDLRIEIQKHPALLKILHEQAEKDIYIQLMEIATYCSILVAGDYTQEDMLGLCREMTKKLMSMRTIIVLL